MNETKLELSILMPVRNEGINIPIALKILNAVVEVPYEVLVVYDDPEDDSIEAVQSVQGRFPHVRLIHNQLGRGVANAIKVGVNASNGEYVLIFAVDEVGPVLAIDDMLELMDRGCDLVSCTRYARGGRRLGGSLIGKTLSTVANKMFHWVAGSSLTDATTGIKMIRRSLFDEFVLESRPVGWSVAFELAIKAQLAGAQLGEIPIVSIDRLFGGESTFSVGPWILEYLRWFFWGWKRLRGQQWPALMTMESDHETMSTSVSSQNNTEEEDSPLRHAA